MRQIKLRWSECVRKTAVGHGGGLAEGQGSCVGKIG